MADTSRLRGLLLGIMVGDALGLPFEGLSPERARRMFPAGLKHRLVFGRGMVSDDTEHACLAALALIRHPDDPRLFARALARSLRWWLLCLPGGAGLATLRATINLWLGFSQERSGVYSAGNGAAVRAAVIGGFLADRPNDIAAFVNASTRVTHTHPAAIEGAMFMALAVAGASGGTPEEFEPENDDLRRALDAARQDLDHEELIRALGSRKGVSGYMPHTIGAVAYCLRRNPASFSTR